MIKSGGHMVLLDVDTANGGLTLNTDFFVDFSNEPYGPTVPHEMRYPGGDCTSDIWLDEWESINEHSFGCILLAHDGA